MYWIKQLYLWYSYRYVCMDMISHYSPSVIIARVHNINYVRYINMYKVESVELQIVL